MLPFFLGLFFFLLLGLVPSGVLFRFGDPIRPVPAWPLGVASVFILVVTYVVSAYVEYRLLPGHVAVKVRQNITGGFPKGYRRETLDAHVAQIVHDYLVQRYGTANPVGYVKWAATSGQITIPAEPIEIPGATGDGDPSPVTLELAKPAIHRLHQPGKLWCIRVAVSFGLLALAVVMQVFPLRKPVPMLSTAGDDAEAVPDAVPPATSDAPEPIEEEID
jgi:hypothetical protein